MPKLFFAKKAPICINGILQQATNPQIKSQESESSVTRFGQILNVFGDFLRFDKSIVH